MIVFHGTAGINLASIKAEGLRARLHDHVQKKCACTSTDFEVAAVFAVRRTSSEDWLKTRSITGIVLEFELTGTDGTDYMSVRDSHSMQDESEIAIFRPKRLRLLAHWVYTATWVRHPLEAQ